MTPKDYVHHCTKVKAPQRSEITPGQEDKAMLRDLIDETPYYKASQRTQNH